MIRLHSRPTLVTLCNWSLGDLLLHWLMATTRPSISTRYSNLDQRIAYVILAAAAAPKRLRRRNPGEESAQQAVGRLVLLRTHSCSAKRRQPPGRFSSFD